MKKSSIIGAGLVIGFLAVLLVKLGNPANMGMCIACFLRDMSGALGLQRTEVVQYIRPEIIGIVLGSLVASIGFKEFSAKGGSSPFTRFLLAIAVAIGALVFLGCPLRMILRIAGGDLNAIVGLVGFTVGIGVGIFFLNKGFTLKRNYKQSNFEGYAFPFMMAMLTIFLVLKPAFIFFSKEGPGSMHAPVVISLVAGLIVGILAQRTRLCMVGGIRDLVLFKDSYLILGFISILIAAFIGNILVGSFSLGFEKQPIAHMEALWNFSGMVITGWGSVLLGGCPLRQLILSGEGNTDSAITVTGILVGSAIAHNFGLASSAKGATANGKFAVGILLVALLIVSILYSNLKDSQVKA